MINKMIYFILKNKKYIFIFTTLFLLMLITKLDKGYIEVFKQEKMKNMRVVIDPGHGGIDGGSVCKDLLEKNINLDIALRVKQKLIEKNINVIITRDNDISLESECNLNQSRHKNDLYARKNIINKSDANSFISIHINSNKDDSSCKGAVIYYNPIYYESSDLSKRIAKEINNEIYDDFLHGKYVKTKILAEDYYLLREAYVPGVLIELGFITNPYDRSLLKNEEYKGRISNAISEGIAKYLSKLDDDLKTGILGF